MTIARSTHLTSKWLPLRTLCSCKKNQSLLHKKQIARSTFPPFVCKKNFPPTKLLFAYNKNIYECVVLIARSTFPPFVCKKNFPPTKLLFAYNKNIFECVVLITRSTFVSKDHIWGRPLIHMRSKHHNVARLMCFCAISCAKCSFDRNFCGSLDLISVLWLKRTVNDNTSNHSIDIWMALVCP